MFETLVSNQTYDGGPCEKCFSNETTALKAVRCSNCKRHLCSKCDHDIHSLEPFHNRVLVSNATLEALQPTDFFDEEWCLLQKGESNF